MNRSKLKQKATKKRIERTKKVKTLCTPVCVCVCVYRVCIKVRGPAAIEQTDSPPLQNKGCWLATPSAPRAADSTINKPAPPAPTTNLYHTN